MTHLEPGVSTFSLASRSAPDSAANHRPSATPPAELLRKCANRPSEEQTRSWRYSVRRTALDPGREGGGGDGWYASWLVVGRRGDSKPARVCRKHMETCATQLFRSQMLPEVARSRMCNDYPPPSSGDGRHFSRSTLTIGLSSQVVSPVRSHGGCARAAQVPRAKSPCMVAVPLSFATAF